uniref:Uncharacterized protein n=1 Tax=Chromera velia CCMP2878 TaxID=1169474 RepID=A0A0G4IBN5_9ALVE|eukprot:Cvel_12807.t1-p1 / transcript=Cvel_12807.t1 / gene=Cvel_12807 / organism=Chromera_velia_CCMP2878 / gene_product=Protein transport protein sec1, putative / transcript_product=Protein transport protein sec1, putative / location=Cvel_scaffold853:29415-39592(+) / protein_length=697 / sequence_SO=supercontig / SO=protein_coding / is_pseudo=false
MCKRRIIEEMVRPTHGSEEYIAMIVDDKTLKVLNCCCKVSDILEEGVTVVEKIDKKRQPLPELDALYFLSPDNHSVKLLLEDFANEKRPQHRHVHIFFSSPLGEESSHMEKIAANPRLFPRIKTFMEMNLNFAAYESRTFHFDSPRSLIELFPLTHRGSEVLNDIADKILAVCATLGEKSPEIRYQTSPFPPAEQIARNVATRIDNFTRNLQPKDGRCTLLIVDRSIDLATMVLHEYTYQSMVFDVLEIPVCELPHKKEKEREKETTRERRNSAVGDAQGEKDGQAKEKADREGVDAEGYRQDDTFEYDYTNPKNQKEKKVAVLGEQDDLWVRFRHLHISEVYENAADELKELANTNVVARLHKGEKLSTADTAAAIRQLPQYQETIAKYFAHVTMSERCFAEYESRQLANLGELEQDLATGVEKGGQPIKDVRILTALSAFLSSPTIKKEDKWRLIALYFLMMEGVTPDALDEMLDRANLTLEQKAAMKKLVKLKLHESEDAGPSGKPSSRVDKDRQNHFKQRARREDIFELSRFEPVLKGVLERTVKGTLDKTKFPCIEGTGSRGLGGAKKGGSSMILGGRGKDKERGEKDKDKDGNSGAMWDWGDASTGAGSAVSAAGGKSGRGDTKRGGAGGDKEKDRIIIFVLGGVTFAEMRSAYEISNALGVEVFIGGTSVMTPRHLLEVCNLAASERALG